MIPLLGSPNGAIPILNSSSIRFIYEVSPLIRRTTGKEPKERERERGEGTTAEEAAKESET